MVLLLALILIFAFLPAPCLLRPPLVSYAGQPVPLSVAGMRSAEATKAAKYAAHEILQDQVRAGHVSRCMTAEVPEIQTGTSKVVAGIQYKLLFRIRFKPSLARDCRSEGNLNAVEDTCEADVIYQPYKPAVATFALVHYICDSNTIQIQWPWQETLIKTKNSSHYTHRRRRIWSTGGSSSFHSSYNEEIYNHCHFLVPFFLHLRNWKHFKKLRLDNIYYK